MAGVPKCNTPGCDGSPRRGGLCGMCLARLRPSGQTVDLPERIFVADLSGEGDFTWVASEAEKPARDDLTWVEYRRSTVPSGPACTCEWRGAVSMPPASGCPLHSVVLVNGERPIVNESGERDG